MIKLSKNLTIDEVSSNKTANFHDSIDRPVDVSLHRGNCRSPTKLIDDFPLER